MGMFAQENIEAAAQREAAETKDVATRALETLHQIGKQDNFKTLGFESSDEMAGATLEEPMVVLMVELEDLRGYQAGSDPNKLLKPINKVIYPVSAKERVRSSITLQKGKEGWKASDFGGGNFARPRFGGTRTKREDGEPAAERFLCRADPGIECLLPWLSRARSAHAQLAGR